MCEPVAHCSTAINSNSGGCGGGGRRTGGGARISGCGGKISPRHHDPNQLWEIKKILDARTVNRKRRYLVRWMDPACQDTWEPPSCFTNKKFLRDFDKKQRRGMVAKKGKLSPKPAARGNAGPRSTTSRKGKVTPTPPATRRNVRTTRSAPKKDEVAPVPVTRKKATPPTSGKKVPAAAAAAAVPPIPRPRPSPLSRSNRTETDHVQLEKIFCGYDTAGGAVQYVVQYRGEEGHRIVPAQEIHARFPQQALAFYTEGRAYAGIRNS